MADKGAQIDYSAHEHTYSRFIGLFKWGAVASFIAAFIVIMIIT